MVLQRPGKFRWQITRPNNQLIVTNGSKLWIYDPDLQQVTIRMLGKEAGEVPALLLSNPTTTLARNFDVKRTDKNGSGLQWFVLTPRDRGSMFQAIQSGFANNAIQQMLLQDHLGQTTQIQFNRIVMNASLPSSSLFNFTPPGRVDVIDETTRR